MGKCVKIWNNYGITPLLELPAGKTKVEQRGIEVMNELEYREEELEAVRLTKREVEILLMVIEGHSSKVIADMLFISKRTVDFHLDNVYGKLKVKNKMQALQRAVKLGLLPQVA